MDERSGQQFGSTEECPESDYSDRRESRHPNRLKHQRRCPYPRHYSNRSRLRTESGTPRNWNGGGNCLPTNGEMTGYVQRPNAFQGQRLHRLVRSAGGYGKLSG